MKDQQKAHWTRVADGWAAWSEWTERNFTPITDWLSDAADWRPGARVLDVASGPGYPALIAAARVSPGGRVVATDISAAMMAATARRAAALGLDNVECLEMDAEELRFPNTSFDAVTNAYGLMFCPDPRRALAECHRVLEPGGRVAVVTWAEPSKSPFLSVIHGVAATFLSLSAPDPTTPGPFRLADPDALATLLRDSGFADVRVDCRAMTIECASASEYFEVFSDVAWKARIALLNAEDAARFRQAVSAAVQPFVDDGRVRLVATSLCASGRTP